MHNKLSTIDIFSEKPLSFASLDYINPLETARSFLCKDGAFPRVETSLPQRLGKPLKATFEQTQTNRDDPMLFMDPLDEIVSISRTKIPELTLNQRPINDVLACRPEKGAQLVSATPKKRAIDNINNGTPTASVLKRRKAAVQTDADMSYDISTDGFIGTDKILGMVDRGLIDTPEKNIVPSNPKVSVNAPGPSPRNLAPKYLYDDHGKEQVQTTFTQFNPFRTANMPPPNWRQMI